MTANISVVNVIATKKKNSLVLSGTKVAYFLQNKDYNKEIAENCFILEQELLSLWSGSVINVLVFTAYTQNHKYLQVTLFQFSFDYV